MYVHAAYYPRIHTYIHNWTYMHFILIYSMYFFYHLSFISCSCNNSFKSVGVSHASFAHWLGKIFFFTHSSWQICFRYFLKILFGWLWDFQWDSDLRFWFSQCKAFTCLFLNTLVLLLLCVFVRYMSQETVEHFRISSWVIIWPQSGVRQSLTLLL